MIKERRQFTRIPFRVKAEITVNKRIYSVSTIDNLSISGCLLPIDADVEPETQCRLKIFLSGTNNELYVLIGGKIIRCEPGALAVRFTEIEPESLFHLQNIIRFNSPNTEQVEKEIKQHPGLK